MKLSLSTRRLCAAAALATGVAALGGCREGGRLPSWAEFLDTGGLVSGELLELGGRVAVPLASDGVAIASRDAVRSFGAACVGWLPDEAQHTVRLSEETSFRVRAEGVKGEDLVLVITGKNGTLCNDDDAGVSPGMQVRLDAGDYAVFVGLRTSSAHPAEGVRYRLWVEPARDNRAFEGLSSTVVMGELERLGDTPPPLSGPMLDVLEDEIDVQRTRIEGP